MAGSRAHAFVVAGATLALLAGTPRDSVAQGLPPAIDVVSYEAVVALDVPARSVRGTVSITFSQLTQTGSVTFDSGNLVVDAVREDTSVLDRDRERRFEQRDRKLTVFIDGVADTRTLVVDYHGSPTRGLLFRADPPQAFTIFTTSEWMPCIDAPEDKATLDLTIVTDASYTVVGNGRRGLSGGGKPGQQRTEFVENRPMPSYTFGFAVGDFSEATSARGGIPLRVLGAGPSIDDVQTLFTDTRDAMAFFADRAGVPYPEASYTMVFAGNGVGQELAAFSILPLSAREALFKDPHATLGLHELAHQWWGNLVTCRDWTHFWLNEGFATFMTAAFLEQKSGRDAYDRIAEYWKTRYDQLREAGHDKPLVFPDWNRPTADDRAVVYSKGAYVLSLLRNTMGDDVFWKGLRDYTTKYAGKSVVTADFVKAMEESSGQSLSAFAAQWIYGQ